MDRADIPAEYQEAYETSMDNLNKLRNSENILHEEANVLNLLNSGLASQAKLIESLVKQMPNLHVDPQRQASAAPISEEIDSNWKDHLLVTRNIMRAIDITKRKEKGQLTSEKALDLIFEPDSQLEGATDLVPESCVRNITVFDSSSGRDLDIKLEGFLKSIYEAGSTNKLSHKAMKTLVIRKLSPQALMLIESYLDTSDKKLENVSLRQIVGILEECYAQSDPRSALQKLQSLEKITNGDYFSACAVISRLVKLSVRKEGSKESRQILQESRAAEYMRGSLPSRDAKIIRSEELKRVTELKGPMSALKIASFLTLHHQNQKGSGEDQDSPSISSVNRVMEGYDYEQEPAFMVRRQAAPPSRGRGQYFQKGNRHNSIPNFQGARQGTNFQGQYNRGFNRNPQGFVPQRRNPSNNQNSYNPQSGYNNNAFRQNRPQNTQFPQGRTNFTGQNNQRRPQRGSFRGTPRGSRGSYRGPENRQEHNRPFVTYTDAKVEYNQCIMCGSTLHTFNSWDCAYRGICRPQKENCAIHKKYSHPTQACLGDLTTNQAREEDTSVGLDELYGEEEKN